MDFEEAFGMNQPNCAGKGWTLDLYWTNRRVPLVYRRTNADLSSEDAKRLLYTENGCYVPKVH